MELPIPESYPAEVTDEEWAMYWRGKKFEAKPERREALLQESKAHADDSVRHEPGTQAFFFIQDEQDRNRFYAVEHHKDRKAQRTHTEGQVIKRNAPPKGWTAPGRTA